MPRALMQPYTIMDKGIEIRDALLEIFWSNYELQDSQIQFFFYEL